MKATGLAIFGGLLKGVGSGIQQGYEEKRQNALLALKRGWDLEDSASAAAAKAAADARDFEQKKELLGIGAGYDKEKIEATGAQNRLTEAQKAETDIKKEGIKFENDKKLETLKSKLNMTETQARIAAELSADITKEGKTVDHWDITSDGRLVGISSTGQVIAKSSNAGSFNPKNAGDAGDDGEGSISGARDRRGVDRKPAASEKVAEESVDANVARTLYANATPERAPRLFRNGKKIPYAEFEAMMKGAK